MPGLGLELELEASCESEELEVPKKTSCFCGEASLWKDINGLQGSVGDCDW